MQRSSVISWDVSVSIGIVLPRVNQCWTSSVYKGTWKALRNSHLIGSKVLLCIPFSSLMNPSKVDRENSCLPISQMKKWNLWYLSSFTLYMKQLQLLLKRRFWYCVL